ncbi:hypothetical protein ACXYMU_13045 [Pontibacter sp. CAU 1760]
MENERAEGIGSLLLLLLAIVAITFGLNLVGTADPPAPHVPPQYELMPEGKVAALAPPQVKPAAKKRSVL